MPAKLLLSAVGDQEVSNDATETSIFSGTVTGGTLGTDSLLVLRMISDILNNTGSAQTVTLRVKFGGTTIHTFTTISLASNVDRYADITTVFLGAEGATNAQRSMMEHKQTGACADGAVAGGNDHNTSVNSLAIDSTVDQTLQITVQLAAADVNLKYRRRGVWVEHESTSLPAAVGDGTQLLALVIPGPGQGIVRNTTTETSVITQTIPAGTLSTGNLLIVELIGDTRNFSGGNAQWWMNGYFGGTQFFTPLTGVSNGSDTRRYGFPVEFWIGGAGATNAQRCAVIGHGVSLPAGSGEGPIVGSGQANNSRNAMTIDTTTDQTFEAKVDFNTASPDVDYRLLAAVFQVIKA